MTKRLLGGLLLSLLVAACASTEDMETSDTMAEAPPPEIASDMSSEAAPSATESMKAEPMAPDPATMADEYTVFFSFNSPILTPEAEAVIDQAVAAAVAKGRVGFAVTGFADGVGSQQQNQTMSRWRAQAVADELVFRGVSETAIETNWQGEADSVGSGESPEQADRRVVIQLL